MARAGAEPSHVRARRGRSSSTTWAFASSRCPVRKFNGAQRLAYTGVVAMGAGSLLTGLAIYKPVQFAWLTTLLGGYPLARLEHFVLARRVCRCSSSIHITQVIRAGWNNFRAMVIGVEVSKDQEAIHGPAT